MTSSAERVSEDESVSDSGVEEPTCSSSVLFVDEPEVAPAMALLPSAVKMRASHYLNSVKGYLEVACSWNFLALYFRIFRLAICCYSGWLCICLVSDAFDSATLAVKSSLVQVSKDTATRSLLNFAADTFWQRQNPSIGIAPLVPIQFQNALKNALADRSGQLCTVLVSIMGNIGMGMV